MAALTALLASPAASAAAPTLFSRRAQTAARLEAAGDVAPTAFVKGDRLRLYFSTPAGLTLFKAHWKSPPLMGETYTSSAARLVLDRTPPPLPTRDDDWLRATVVSVDDWPALARASAESLAPESSPAATLVQLLNFEALLYRDDAGVLREAPLAAAPANLSINRTVNADEFAAALVRTLEQQRSTAGAGPLFLLRPRLDPNRPGFILVDLSRKLSVWVSPPMPPNDPRGRPRYAVNAKMLGSLAVESHGLALLKNPVSALGRLVNLGVHALSRVLPPPLPTFPKSPPAVRPSAGMDLPRFEHLLDRLTDTRQTSGTVRLLIDGGQFFPAFEESLRAARESIHIRVGIFDTDDVAVDLAELLRRRAEEVDVRVLLDRMSSLAAAASPPESPMRPDFEMPSSIRRTLERDSRVRVRAFLNPWLSADHSKVFLVDDQVAYLGGMNIGREYRYEWHDLMVELRGPVVASLANDFDRAWSHAGWAGDLGYLARALFPTPRPAPGPPPPDAIPLRVLKTLTLDYQVRSALFAALLQARSYAFLENPYLTDLTVAEALTAARRRGVDVRVILPNRNDMLGVESHNFVTANALLRQGVRVFVHPGMTHVKAALVDGWVLLGSANFNNFSLRLNQEVNIATSDPAFAAEVRERLFETDFQRGHELTNALPVGWTDHLAERILSQF